MAQNTNSKTAEQRLEGLEKQVEELLAERTGGILSGGHICERVLTGEDAETYLEYFEKRQWNEMSKWWKEKKGNQDGWKKKIIIKDFNELNITPFSYDLSMGSQVFSIQKPKDGVKPLSAEKPYPLQPGETVVVITAEKVAIPHAYSATVWPRFNMVKRGVFQSMVKIDPTWHGHLAIAMSNLSPAVVELKYGKAFATLLFYELSKESDVDLWKLEDIQEKGIEVVEKIPKEFIGDIDRIDEHIFNSKELRGYCYVRNQSIVAWGIKREHVKALKGCLADERWHAMVDRLSKNWAVKVYDETKKRIIVMPALGMYDLRPIVGELSEEGYMTEDSVLTGVLGVDSLVEAAVKYGKPFDVFAKIPDTIIERIEEEKIPKIEAEVESKIQIRVILLVFSMFGFISLVIAILVMMWRVGGQEDFIKNFTNWSGLCGAVGVIGGITGIGFLLLTLLTLRRNRQVSNRPKRRERKWRKDLKKEQKAIRDSRTDMEKQIMELRQAVKEMQQLESKVNKKENNSKNPPQTLKV